MNTKIYLKLSGAIFGIITVLHLLRAVYGWNAMIGGLTIPLWASWLALAAAGCLAYSALSLYRKA